MLRNQTLFVVGAGASFEFGLPLGTALAEKISAKLHFKFDMWRLIEGNEDFLSALRQKFSDEEILKSHLDACSRIKSGIRLAKSVDNYIDTHKHDTKVALIGKFAIFDCIAEAERSSKLYFEPNSSKVTFDLEKLGKTWVAELVDILFYGVSKSNVADVFANLSIVSFNYDRCIQQALVLALHTLYHLDISQCYELVSKLRIIYPYGSLGTLSSIHDANSVPFGADIFRPYLFELSKNIRTYSEQVADVEMMTQISNEVTKAKNIVFLGCAYHQQNIDMLKSQSIALDKTILGTAHGISNDGVLIKSASLFEAIFGITASEALSEKVSSKYEAYLKVRLFNNLKCFELMNEFRHSLQK